MVRDFIVKLKAMSVCLAGMFCVFSNEVFSTESDREDGSYCPPVKRERTSSLNQFPPSQSGKCCYAIINEGIVFLPRNSFSSHVSSLITACCALG